MAESTYFYGHPSKVNISAQFDQALVCLEEFTKSCKGLYSYAKKRFALEKEYAKGLQKLARSSIDASLTPKGVQFQGDMSKCWQSALQATLECAEMKLSSTVNLEHTVLASLGSVFDGELSRTRKDMSNQGHQSVKNLQDVVQLLHKAQTAYVGGAQDWQNCLLQLHRDLGGEWKTIESAKQRDKESGLSRKCEESKQAYLAAIRQANNTQHLHHFDQMPPLLTQLSELSEDIVVVARQSVIHLLEQADLLQRSVAPQAPRVQVAPSLSMAKSLDPKSYTSDFIFCHMTADMVEPPRPFVFEEFLMEDAAAHLFFQKTQSECRQLFPESEEAITDTLPQIDNNGFFIGVDSPGMAAESDQERLRRHFTASTDTIPVSNSRSSVTYMLALRKAVLQSKGEPVVPMPSSTEARPLAGWLPRRRKGSNMGQSNSSPMTPTSAAPGWQGAARRPSMPIGNSAGGEAKRAGNSSWYVEEEDESGDAVGQATRDPKLGRLSRSDGDIFEHSVDSGNPYASVDSMMAGRKPRPTIPPRPAQLRRAMTETTEMRPSPSPVERPRSVTCMTALSSEASESDDCITPRSPPPLPGEDEDVYSAPILVGSPSSLAGVPQPTERVGYLAPLPHLAQVCVQYLGTKRGLHEEGLFRVPGNITRIRQLKSAFDALENSTNSWSSGRSLASFLESEIQKERDPNTVSGLLKMFLREQNYITAQQCKSLVDTLYPNRTLGTLQGATGDVSILELGLREKLPNIESGDMGKVLAIKAIIKEELSSVAQSVLAAMCSLLARVANEGDKNRMTSHSLGMCCGLSVFPAMSTGHAASVLRFMIQNSKDLFDQ